MTNEVQTVDENIINPNVQATNSLLNMIERLAQNPEIDVTKMVAIMDLQERIMNKNAEIAFNIAYSEMSSELPRIIKKKEVTFKNKETGKMETAYKYEDIVDIDDVVRPILIKYGFTLSFLTDVKESGGMIVRGILAHREGYSRETSMPLALDTSGGKNNLQGAGSTIKYGIRYATKTLLNLIIIDEQDDNDGNPAIEYIDDAQFEEITKLIEASQSDTEKFCIHLKVSALKEITKKQYPKAVMDLNDKINKLKGQK